MRRAGRLIVLALFGVAACGGGGGGGGGGAITNSPPTGGAQTPVTYTPGVYQPRQTLAAQCARPRTGNDPTGRPWPDRPGTAATENNFLRSWTNELYLWYREAPDLNPNSYTDTLQYFDLLKTTQTTANGEDKDRFHFTYDTDDYIALVQESVALGYGLDWYFDVDNLRIVAAYVEPNSVAASAGVARGAEVLRIDGVDPLSSQAALDAAIPKLFPEDAGVRHTFRFRRANGTEFEVSLTAQPQTMTPVPVVRRLTGDVGYILFRDHNVPSEAQLADAIRTLSGVDDLILDLRYNSGGYLDIASALGYMIAGSNTSGRQFERLQFNDKHPSTDPVTGQPLTPTPFHTVGGFGTTDGVALPTLNLSRVYVLTGEDTCSASESIINGLNGISVPVYLIGARTCGKPFGFYAQENCGTTYFSIQFRGVNEQGWGSYEEGFRAQNSAEAAGVPLPGCDVPDDFTRDLGDESEGKLAAALAFRSGNNSSAACPPRTALAGVQAKRSAAFIFADRTLLKPPVRTNRILRDR